MEEYRKYEPLWGGWYIRYPSAHLEIKCQGLNNWKLQSKMPYGFINKEMKMLADIRLTPGTSLFLAGIIILILAVLLSLGSALTAKKRKRRLEEKMREKY